MAENYFQTLQNPQINYQGIANVGAAYGSMLSNVGAKVGEAVKKYKDKKKSDEGDAYIANAIKGNKPMMASLGITEDEVDKIVKTEKLGQYLSMVQVQGQMAAQEASTRIANEKLYRTQMIQGRQDHALNPLSPEEYETAQEMDVSGDVKDVYLQHAVQSGMSYDEYRSGTRQGSTGSSIGYKSMLNPATGKTEFVPVISEFDPDTGQTTYKSVSSSNIYRDQGPNNTGLQKVRGPDGSYIYTFINEEGKRQPVPLTNVVSGKNLIPEVQVALQAAEYHKGKNTATVQQNLLSARVPEFLYMNEKEQGKLLTEIDKDGRDTLVAASATFQNMVNSDQLSQIKTQIQAIQDGETAIKAMDRAMTGDTGALANYRMGVRKFIRTVDPGVITNADMAAFSAYGWVQEGRRYVESVTGEFNQKLPAQDIKAATVELVRSAREKLRLGLESTKRRLMATYEEIPEVQIDKIIDSTNVIYQSAPAESTASSQDEQATDWEAFTREKMNEGMGRMQLTNILISQVGEEETQRLITEIFGDE